ncbi:hypothetical protein [Jannaschia aquimarina]|uniref:Nodulation protein NodH n=1 Tax=Jannaschia aquimarina TaxID=935700 RepID=A0A0D1EGX9_9RHOB|nr:hypothetical protein [Jannaschia aquimarina]KIT15105.1 hypothetical protein jaqu_34320 [Jannaschia aquimarina]SNS64218.1 hypothetical protein SAMN05421775_101758 [Jannaschia aquimarina]
MSSRFDAFVLLAGMRTGSNHLEATLNSVPGIESHGEVFNPVFIGKHNRSEMHGMAMADRDRAPLELLRRVIENADGLPGFRLFGNHDPRVLDAILPDPAIAKIVLGRNPLEAYISLKIARETDQWMLKNPKMAKSVKVSFDGAEFDEMVSDERAFRSRIRRELQVTGQSAFWIDYAEIGDRDIIDGLVRFLGMNASVETLGGRLKRQNPGPVEDKVINPEALQAHLDGLDPFGLTRAPDGEPAGGPAVPTMMAAAGLPILVLPIPGGPTEALEDWLTRLAGGAAPTTGMSQKALRRWMRANEGFTSLTIVSHPLDRAYRVFCDHVLAQGQKPLRQVLERHYNADLSEMSDQAAFRTAFAAFLRFVKANLGGQTALPVRSVWGRQTTALHGMSQVVPPMRVVRGGDAEEVLPQLLPGAPDWIPAPAQDRIPLAAIYDAELEDLSREAWRRDYVTFGFGAWKG